MQKISRLIVLLCLVLLLATPAVSAAEAKLRFAVGWGSQPDQFIPLIEEFTKRTGIQIEPVIIPGSYHNAIMVQYASGVLPDLYMVDLTNFSYMVSIGAVLRLEEYYARDVDFKQFLPIFDSSRVNGVLYGFPAEGGGYRTDAMYVNRDVFLEGGLAYPSPRIEDALTYDEVLTIARKLTRTRSGEGVPYQFGIWASLPTRWLTFVPGAGAKIFNEDKTEVLVNSPEMVNLLRFFQDMVTNYGVFGGKFESGNVAMDIRFRAQGAVWVDAIGDRFDWSVAPFPAGPAGPIGTTRMNSLVISSSTKYPNEAWEFIKFLMSDEVQHDSAKAGRAVALRSAAIAYLTSSKPPYDLRPFIEGPAVDWGTMLPPPGGVWPTAAVNNILNQTMAGQMAPESAVEQLEQVLKSMLADIKP